MRQTSRVVARDGERGASLIFYTILMSVLLGLASMVIDAGLAYWNRRLLQNAVDAAALAGATHLPGDPDLAIAVARSYASSNGVPNEEIENVQVVSTLHDDDTLAITARRMLLPGLRGLVGVGDVDIRATAQAIVVAKKPSDIAPFGVTMNEEFQCEVGEVCELKVGVGDSSAGNFHLLDFDGSSGAAGIVENILYGYDGVVPEPVGMNQDGEPYWDWQVQSETGGMTGPIRNAIGKLFDWDAQQYCFVDESNRSQDCSGLYVEDPGGYNPEPENGNLVCYDHLSCPRVVLIPFISNSWEEQNGKSWVQVTNFGCFYLYERPQQQGGFMTVRGIFVKFCNDVHGEVDYDWEIDTGTVHTRTLQVLLWR